LELFKNVTEVRFLDTVYNARTLKTKHTKKLQIEDEQNARFGSYSAGSVDSRRASMTFITAAAIAGWDTEDADVEVDDSDDDDVMQLSDFIHSTTITKQSLP